jgi:hypothetical protein
MQGWLGPWLEKVLQHYTMGRPVLQTTVQDSPIDLIIGISSTRLKVLCAAAEQT